MSEWKEYKLGDLYDVHNGLSKGGKFFGSGYPFLTFSNVFNNYFIPSDLSSLVQSTEKERSACNILAGDIFVTRTSETAEELGMSCVALKDYPNATYNGFTKRLRKKEDCTIEIDSRFIGYYLRSRKFRSLFYGIAGGMSTRASLANNDLLRMVVCIPPYEEQVRIGRFLADFDDKIGVNIRICENLGTQVQALFKHWFIDFAPFQKGNFVQSELGSIPEGWRVDTLGSIIIENEKSKIQVNQAYKSGNYPFFTSGAKILRYNEYFVSGHNIFLNTGGVADVKFKIGKAAYSTDTWCIRGQEAYTDYLYLYLSRNIKMLNKLYFEGSALKHLQKKKLKDRLILIPSKDVMNGFNSIVCKKLEMIELLKEENAKLSSFRDTLLPKFMSGQIKL